MVPGKRDEGGGARGWPLIDCTLVGCQPRQSRPRSGGQVLFRLPFFMEADLHGMGCLLKQRAAWKGGGRCQVGSDL